MNSTMRIEVRVQNGKALAQINSLNKGIQKTGLTAKAAGLAMNTSFLSAFGRGVINAGRNMQWLGRQVEFRLSLPLIAAGAAASKYALDVDRAMTRVRKVYGDISMSQQQVDKEVAVLGRAFRALSDIFGVHQAQVVEVAAAWAQTGVQGEALAKVTRTTLEAAVLGELELAEATKGLITVQRAYGLSTQELSQAIADLNVVENETAVNTGDLIEVISVSGAIAREAGVSYRELAALTASLVPAFGTASEAGNSLKSILFRVMAPTNQATEAMARLGINIDEAAWQSETFTGRLQILSNAYEGLTQNQKIQFAADVAMLRQGNKLIGMLGDLTSASSSYVKALNASADATKNVETLNRELGVFLSSTPQALSIVTTRFKNLMGEIMLPLLPAIIAVAEEVVKLVQKFTELSPAMQKAILGGLAFIAVLGPIMGFVGAILIVIGSLSTSLVALAKAFGLLTAGKAIFAALLSPLTLVKGAVLALLSPIGAVVKAFLSVASRVRAVVSTFAAATAGAARLTASVMRVVSTFGRVAASGVAVRVAFASAFSALPSIITAVGARIAASWIGTMATMAASTTVGATLVANSWWILPALVGAAGVAAMVALTLAVAAGIKGVAGSATKGSNIVARVFHTGFSLAAKAVNVAMGLLPAAVYGPMAAVVSIVASAAKAVYAWLQWMNPFARHSPSLVERVTDGTAIIAQKYAALGTAGQPLVDGMRTMTTAVVSGTTAAVAGFNSLALAVAGATESYAEGEEGVGRYRKGMTDGLIVFDEKAKRVSKLQRVLDAASTTFAEFSAAIRGTAEALEQAEFDKKLAEIEAFNPDAVDEFLRMQEAVRKLEGQLEVLQKRIEAQEAVVEMWKQAIEHVEAEIAEAEKALGRMERAAQKAERQLERMRNGLDEIGEAADKARSDLEELERSLKDMNNPFKGQGAKGDAIFDKDQEIKRAELELKRLERAWDDMSDGEREAAGGRLDELKALVKRLEEEREILQLEHDVAYDRKERERDKAINPPKEEVEFDKQMQMIEEIRARMKEKEKEIKQIEQEMKVREKAIQLKEKEVKALNKEVRQQERLIGALERKRERMSARYDKEVQKLGELKAKFQEVKDVISEMKSAMEEFAQAASDAAEAAKAAAGGGGGGFGGPGGGGGGGGGFGGPPGAGDFERPGGDGSFDYGDGDLLSMEELAEKWEEEARKAFEGIDILGPLKEKLNEVTTAWNEFWSNFGSEVKASPEMGAFSTALQDLATWLAPVGAQLKGISPTVRKVAAGLGLFLAAVLALSTLGPIAAIAGLTGLSTVGVSFGLLAAAAAAVGVAFVAVKKGAIGVARSVGVTLLDAVKTIGEALTPVIEEFKKWKTLIGPLKGALRNIGIVLVAVGNVLLWFAKQVLDVLRKAWNGLVQVFQRTGGRLARSIGKFSAGAIEAVRGLIELVLSIVALDWAGIVRGVKTIFEGLGKALYFGVQAVIQAAVMIIEGAWRLIVGTARTFGRIIAAALEGVWKIVKGLLAKFVGLFTSSSEEAYSGMVMGPEQQAPIVRAVQWVWDQIKGAIGTAWEAIKAALSTAWGAIKDVFTPDLLVSAVGLVWTAIKGAVSGAWGLIKTAVSSVWDTFSSIFGIDALVTAVGLVWTAIKAAVGPAWELIKTAVSTWWDTFSSIYSVDTLVTAVGLVWTAIKTAAEIWWAGFKTTVGLLWTAISSIFSADTFTKAIGLVWTAIKTAAETWWAGFKTALGLLWDGVTALWDNKEVIANKIQEIWDSVLAAIPAAWEAIKTAVSTAWEGIVTWLDTHQEAMSSAVGQVWQLILDAIPVAWDLIKGAVSTAWGTIITWFNENGFALLGTALETGWTAITTAVGLAWTAIKTLITTKWGKIKTAIEKKLTNIKTMLGKEFTAFKTLIGNRLGNTKTLITTKWKNIKTAIEKKLTNIKIAIGREFGRMKKIVGEKLGAMKKAVDTKFNAIKNKINAASKSAREDALRHFEVLKSKTNAKMGAIREKVFEAWNKIKNKINDAAKAVRDVAGSAFNTFKETVLGGLASIASAVGPVVTALNGLKDLWGRVKGAAAGGIPLPGGVGGSSFTGASNFGADGAIQKAVKGGALWTVAENGGDELMINQRSSDSRKLGLIKRFDNGRLYDQILASQRQHTTVTAPSLRIQQSVGLLPATSGGGNTININGDLSFPNITDGDDSEALIRNLEAYAQ